MMRSKRSVLWAAVSVLGASGVAAQQAPPPAPPPSTPPPGAPPPAETPPAPAEPLMAAIPKWSDPDIAKVGDMLKGTWKTTSTVPGAKGATPAEVVMSVAPVVIHDLPDAMYVEIARADSMHAPYKRSVFQLARAGGALKLRALEATTPEARQALDQWTGFWAAPDVLALITATSIDAHGLTQTMELDVTPAAGGFAGKTAHAYPTKDGGAAEMTSEFTLAKDMFTSADRGFDAAKKQVWGPGEKEGYSFARYAAQEPTVEKKPNGLVLLWYKKATAGDTIDPEHRFYAHYTGWIAGGPQSYTSRGLTKPGGPFGLENKKQIMNQVIPGWREAVTGMGVGTNVRMFVPPELGYGDKPRRDRSGKVVVPANSTLLFELEVVGVGPAEKPGYVPLPEGALKPVLPGSAPKTK